MSKIPNSLGSLDPPLCSVWPELPLCQATMEGSSDPEYLWPLVSIPPLAAYSHSASVGRR